MTDPQRRITAVVLTLNEAEHLPDCLTSLASVDELLVFDSGSTDATTAIAASAGAQIVTHPFENYSMQRNAALERVTTEWTLFIDADERVSAELAAEIRSVAATPDVAGFWIPRANWFWGHRIRGGGWWPDHQLRLVRTRAAHYAPGRSVHEVPALVGHADYLENALVHLNYASWSEFRSRQRSYALLEAERRIRDGDRPRMRGYASWPVRELYRRFVRLGGWRDGLLGLLLAGHMAYYELVTLREMRRAAKARTS